MYRRRLASPSRPALCASSLLLCCAATGCGAGDRVEVYPGGQTGGESPATGGGCHPEYRDLLLDEVTPLGATAERVLEPVLGTSAAPLLWRANTDPLTIGPEQGLTQIELTAAHAGGRIAWAHYVPDSEGTGEVTSAPLGCPVDRLEIELDVRVRTSGGALDEHIAATLGAIAVDQAQLVMRERIDALEGSFFVTAPPGFTAPTLQINAVWDALGFRGTLMGEVTMEARDGNASSGAGSAVGFGYVPYADWPPPADGAAP